MSYGSVESERRLITHGVPQGSVSDLLYSTSILAKDVSAEEKCVNKDLKSTAIWWNENGLISNHKKCVAMLIG